MAAHIVRGGLPLLACQNVCLHFWTNFVTFGKWNFGFTVHVFSLVYKFCKRRVRSRATLHELKGKSVYKACGCVFKISCLRNFATRRADNQGVRPLVYRRIYNTQVYQYGRNQNGASMQKERSHLFFVFRPLLCLWFSSFLFFSFSHFLQIAIAAKMIEKLDACNIWISK